ncbi:hypothetical protein [Rubinisphaera margarita]|uniref:hypothetical protein n=1 Tax=Rubinisphaera margarita TaxID=2909586 RepID=UPI001EE7CC8A|nr:hypothetical protein [Rubinisphaera margarita]MCG6154774.1 hypothetical protein [Rubinisphaera margarita]
MPVPPPSSRKASEHIHRRDFLRGMVPFALSLCGCQTSVTNTAPDGQSFLPPLRPGMDTVQLDIVYVERDAEDPLLSQLVWDDVDQVGTVDLKTRSKLREYGFRVGLVGMTPPRTLQRLLGLKNDLTDAAGTSRHTDLIGRRTFLPSGGTTAIQTSLPAPQVKVRLPDEEEEKVLENAHGVLQAEVERLQDGWVRLHLMPELHHGLAQLRPVAGRTEFQYEGGQHIEQLRNLEFTVTMNVGEMLVISADSSAAGKLGETFFVNRNAQRPRRYMVAIRLTDMKKIHPLYEE